MNISTRISEFAKNNPDKKAVLFPVLQKSSRYHYNSITFKEFEETASRFSFKFEQLGIQKGMRVLVFVKPRLDFSAIVFSLFKLGAVPVLIDPGMGLKNLLVAIKEVKPHAMISESVVHWMRLIFRSTFSTVKIKISLKPFSFGKVHWLYDEITSYPPSYKALELSDEELACILFTSGGTGTPKGVLYTHGILDAQTKMLQAMFDLNSTHRDLPGFPLFALFTLAMGMTSVIPDMDPTRPAHCDPKKIVQNLIDQQITFAAGSPAIWEKVADYCLKYNIQLPHVKHLVMFGAPVRPHIHKAFKKILTYGSTYTPYGATECLPVSVISGRELENYNQAYYQGSGICIGKPVEGNLIKIIKPNLGEIKTIQELSSQEVGEIIVSGPTMTKGYFERDRETNLSKIHHNGLWHRMGDMGYFDKDGYLWFVGRVSHCLINQEKNYYPIMVEGIYNQHPKVKRSALIKLKNKQGKFIPAVVIERFDQKNRLSELTKFNQEIINLKNSNPLTQSIENHFYFKNFPVDVRHNIKIDRLKLAHYFKDQV